MGSQNQMTGLIDFPNNVSDKKGILQFADSISDYASAYRFDEERLAMRNILFYIGLQWIRYDRYYRSYRPVALSKRTPRPVTNKYASIVNQVCSALIQHKPPITIGPGSQDADDVASGWAGDKIAELIERESLVRRYKPLAAKWLTLTGDVYLLSSYDNSFETGEEFVQFDRCMTCETVVKPDEAEEAGGVCPECGEANQETESSVFQLAFTPDGDPIGETFPRGAHKLEVKSHFDTYHDYEIDFIDESAYFLVSDVVSRESLKRTFGSKALKDVSGDTYQDSHGLYRESIAYTTPGSYRLLAGAGHQPQERMRLRRLWIKPDHEKNKRGLYAIMVGDKVLDSMEWEYHNEKGDPVFPISHIKFDHVAGKVLGKTRCDDLAIKQAQRNRYESIVELHSRRNASSTWLLPFGVGVSKVSGEQGNFLRYNPLTGVPEPKRVSGDSPPNYLMDMLMLIDKEMDDIMGTYEVSRGEVPQGVSAASALSLLDERAKQGQSGITENWSTGWMHWTQVNLNIWREYADAERISNSGGPGAWAIQKFSKADLSGGVDVRLELGESRPATSTGRTARINQAITGGALNMADPMERFKVLQAFGIPEIMADFKVEMAAAHKRIDLVAEGGQPPPPFPWDNHALFLSVYKRFTYSDAFERMDDQRKMIVMQMMQMHHQMAMGLMEQQAGQAAPGPAAGQGEGTAPGGDKQPEVEQHKQEAQGGPVAQPGA